MEYVQGSTFAPFAIFDGFHGFKRCFRTCVTVAVFRIFIHSTGLQTLIVENSRELRVLEPHGEVAIASCLNSASDQRSDSSGPYPITQSFHTRTDNLIGETASTATIIAHRYGIPSRRFVRSVVDVGPYGFPYLAHLLFWSWATSSLSWLQQQEKRNSRGYAPVEWSDLFFNIRRSGAR